MLAVAPDMSAEMRGTFHSLLGIEKKLAEMRRHKVSHPKPHKPC